MFWNLTFLLDPIDHVHSPTPRPLIMDFSFYVRWLLEVCRLPTFEEMNQVGLLDGMRNMSLRKHTRNRKQVQESLFFNWLLEISRESKEPFRRLEERGNRKRIFPTFYVTSVFDAAP